MSPLMQHQIPGDWYTSAFDTLATEPAPAEVIAADVERLLKIVQPRAGARVLDLASGFGFHAIELARRGFSVVGVDLSSDCIEISEGEAPEGLDLEFILADLREIDFEDEFDIVLNLNDGAIGYLESEEENRRTFEVMARALRPGGASLLHVPNVLYAEGRPIERSWTLGMMLARLSQHRWNPDNRSREGEVIVISLEGCTPIAFSYETDFLYDLTPIGFRQRLYSVEELRQMFASLNMSLVGPFDRKGLVGEPDDSQPEIFALARKEQRHGATAFEADLSRP